MRAQWPLCTAQVVCEGEKCGVEGVRVAQQSGPSLKTEEGRERYGGARYATASPLSCIIATLTFSSEMHNSYPYFCRGDA